VDSEGAAYVVGSTQSDEEDGFPVTVGPDLTYNGDWDNFVAKVDPSGTSLLYCGYIGGSDDEGGETFTDDSEIAVDSEGAAYITGFTYSSENEYENFPVTVGPDLTFNGGWSRRDAFVAKIPPYPLDIWYLRRGNVNTGVGDAYNVLKINGTAGSSEERIYTSSYNFPFTMTMHAPPNPHPQFPGKFALYLITYEPGLSDAAEQPFGIGMSCIPMPLSNGSIYPPPPFTLVNNIGSFAALGYPMLAGIPPAPCVVFDVPRMPPGIFTFQGYIFDGGSSGPGLSLTNAIVLKVVL